MAALASGAPLGARSADAQGERLRPLADLVLTRVAADGGATRAEVIADLAPLLHHKLSPAEWRRTAETTVGHLLASGLVGEGRGRLASTKKGSEAAARFLGRAGTGLRTWAEIRDHGLVAKALGLEQEGASRLKALARPEGLRALVLQKAFGLPLKKNPAPAKLRAQLALVALERAFGNKIKAGVGKGSAFTAKAGRTLAGQLSLNPRDFGTDQKLVAHLAAEQAGAVQIDPEALRAALLKRLGSAVLAAEAAAEERAPSAVAARLAEPANDRGPPPAAAKTEAGRPDLARFARAVQTAARGCAEGWPGNRKAYISQVWQAIRSAEQGWGLSEIEFKCMLAEAHRLGAVVLANADLKDKKRRAEIESSAIAYKNTVWHFVRVED